MELFDVGDRRACRVSFKATRRDAAAVALAERAIPPYVIGRACPVSKRQSQTSLSRTARATMIFKRARVTIMPFDLSYACM